MRTVAHISDIHFGKIDLRIADALAAKLHELSPSLVIVSGDLTQRARGSQFRDAAAYLKRLPQPQLVVPGNHDVPLYDVVRRFFAPTQLYRRYITRELMPVFIDEELIVIGLNSARAFTPRWRGFWKDGSLGSDQVLCAIDTFSGSTSRTKILVTHHPFLPAPGGDPEDKLRVSASDVDRLAAAGVDLLLAGHLHKSYGNGILSTIRGKSAAMLCVQAGTATSTRTRETPNAFNVFHVEAESIELSVYHWRGVTFQADSPRIFLREEFGWHEQFK